MACNSASSQPPCFLSAIPWYRDPARPRCRWRAGRNQAGRWGLGAAEPLAQRPEGEVGKGLRLRKPCSGDSGGRGAVPRPHPAPSSL